MATYATLKNGSRGDDVKKMQESLRSAGYDVGDPGTDGIYGNITEAAVKKYQQDNGLKVDGIAGDETLSMLYGSAGAGNGTGAAPSPTVPEQTADRFDPYSDETYKNAMAYLESLKGQAPTYNGAMDAEVLKIYEQIVNRPDFHYDINSDALYQQYTDQYIQGGKMAMQDAMGQAAAMTGGYGNSFAQSVGQQNYMTYLQQLNEIVPELHDRAYDKYTAETQDLYNRYSLASDMADEEFGRYKDALTQYWNELSFAKGEADSAYDQWYKNTVLGMDADDAEYQRELDAYGRMSELISIGYTPTAAELEAAGMSASEAKALENYYKQQSAVTTGGDEPAGLGSDYREYRQVVKEDYENGSTPTQLYNYLLGSGATENEIRSILLSVISEEEYNAIVDDGTDKPAMVNGVPYSANVGKFLSAALNEAQRRGIQATNASSDVYDAMIEEMLEQWYDKDGILTEDEVKVLIKYFNL